MNVGIVVYFQTGNTLPAAQKRRQALTSANISLSNLIIGLSSSGGPASDMAGAALCAGY